ICGVPFFAGAERAVRREPALSACQIAPISGREAQRDGRGRALVKPGEPAGIRPFHGPAGGWQALKAVAENLARQPVITLGGKTLLRANQPDGFDCPGCAWPDPKHTSSFEFCENGAKAVAWEATSKRATPEFFAAHSVSELATWSDYALENEGRLTHP